MIRQEKKHAYLIMAHDCFEQLALLLECLDYPLNDIFIHIDKKVSCDRDKLLSHVKYSNVFFTKQISVNWGGYSQIATELILLEEATSHMKYQRYHLLTGVDLPLQTQAAIHQFFDMHEDVEFISGGGMPDMNNMWFVERIKYYYPFQEIFSRRNIVGKVLRKCTLQVQKVIKVNRIRNTDMKFNIGSAYFDITDKFARYVVSKKEMILAQFSHSFCADELFLQWVYLHWENANERYISNKTDHPYIAETYFDVCRAIDWTRGKPYTYMDEDFDMLMESRCLFARKIDYNKSPKLVERIIRIVKE